MREYDLSHRVDPLIEDLIVPNTVEHLQNLAAMKSGSQEWLNSVRAVGLLLATLTDEQYSHVCLAYRNARSTTRTMLKSWPTQLIDPPSPSPTSEKGLFS